MSRLNPPWNETATAEMYDEQFEKAVLITGEELVHAVQNRGVSWLIARQIVEKGFKSRFEIHKSGKIVLLPQYCPWGSHLEDLEMESKLKENELPLYVVFCDTSGSWRIRAVSITSGSFESRKALPEPWRGVRDEELSKLTGVEDCVFVHATGFIGGTKTMEGALKLAELALEY